MKIAVAIFCYNRRDKFESLISSLATNKLDTIDKFYIFQDGLKEFSNEYIVQEHSNLKAIWNEFAKSKNIENFEYISRSENIGLRESILDGLDNVFDLFDAVIVLEDDLQLSPIFIETMSNLIYKYNCNTSIGHINGWSNFQTLKFNNNYLVHTSMMYCWGWATWKPHWKQFRKKFDWDKKNFSTYEYINYDFFGLARLIHQLKLNWNGKIKTWAVFWYLYLREENLICAGYAESLTKNIGNDGSGDNCKKIDTDIFSKVFNGEISTLKTIKSNATPYKNSLFFINLILALLYRNFYLLYRKIKK